MNQPPDETRLPLFLYGTLMQGESRHPIIARAITDICPAAVQGLSLYGHGMSFPVAITTNRPEWHIVHGQLAWVDDRLYSQVLERLDLIEGFRRTGDGDNMYDRIEVLADHVDAGVPMQARAWAYVAAPIWRSILRDRHSPIHEGRWAAALPFDPVLKDSDARSE